jgi:hypothetical protein
LSRRTGGAEAYLTGTATNAQVSTLADLTGLIGVSERCTGIGVVELQVSLVDVAGVKQVSHLEIELKRVENRGST